MDTLFQNYLAVVSMVLFVAALMLGNSFWLGVATVLLAIITLLNVAGALLKNKMFGAIENTFIGDRARFITHLKFASVEAMLMNRAKSLVTLTSEVFLNRLRTMNYDTIFSDGAWQNRVITSNIHDLKPDESWEKKRSEGDPHVVELIPSEAMFQNTLLAASMGSTLWFTAQDNANGMPQAILASGQYHMCRRLLT